MISSLSDKSRSNDSNPSSSSMRPNFTVNDPGSLEKRDSPFTLTSSQSKHGSVSIGTFSERHLDMMSIKKQKAETLIRRRENIHTIRKDSSRSITKKDLAKESIFRSELNKLENKSQDVLDKDKRVYKRIMFTDAQDNEPEIQEVVNVHKRTMKEELEDPDFQFKIKPCIFCQI